MPPRVEKEAGTDARGKEEQQAVKGTVGQTSVSQTTNLQICYLRSEMCPIRTPRDLVVTEPRLSGVILFREWIMHR